MTTHLANAHADDEDYAAVIPCRERIVALEPERPQGYIDLGSAMVDDILI